MDLLALHNLHMQAADQLYEAKKELDNWEEANDLAVVDMCEVFYSQSLDRYNKIMEEIESIHAANFTV